MIFLHAPANRTLTVSTVGISSYFCIFIVALYRGSRNTLKRLFDIVISLVGAVVLAVPIVVLSICVAVDLGWPVLFRQQRPGLQGEPFELLKFRTMTDSVDEAADMLPDNQRLTKLGVFLREWSLDELPTLWNVLKGEMSVVGPRPLLVEYLPLYSDEQNRRHDVKPGITGWAQVNGRNRLSWQEKFELDVWYVDNQSLFLDMKILFMTIVRVLQRRDISQEGHATMEKFHGNKL